MLRIIGGYTTKKERDVAIQSELHHLQTLISRPNLNPSQVREVLKRGIICEMLGNSATFLYIHSIKLAQQRALLDKRMGYLAATLFLNGEHELTLLLINTILKDLKSSSVSEVSMALNTAACLANKEMVSVLLNNVEDLMHSHPQALIRKKAILTFKRLLDITPSAVHISSINQLKKCIEDDDPEVVSTLIFAIFGLVQNDPSAFRDLLEPCLDILRQILHRKFPPDYDYHSLPAPWLQIQILKLIPLLSDSEQPISLDDIMEEVLKNVDTNHTISNAILYQCVCAMASVCHQEKLLVTASTLIAKFLHSSCSDMRYMGLKALTLLVTKVHPRFATAHQDLIIESLRHPDASIRSNTFDLLICLVNNSNIHLVWPKLTRHIETTVDECVKKELILRCSHLLHSHSPNAQWTFHQIMSLILMSPSHIHSQLVIHLTNLLCKESSDAEFISVAVSKSMDVLHSSNPSSALVRFCSWVLSEFSKMDSHLMLPVLAQLLNVFMNNHQVQSSLLLAIKKLIISHSVSRVEPEVEKLVRSCIRSSHCLVGQQSRELCQILNHLDVVRGSFETTISQFDWTLSFLDSIVEIDLQAGSPLYLPPSLRKNTIKEQPHTSKVSTTLSSAGSSIANTRRSSVSSSSRSVMSGFSMDNVDRMWSRDGFRMEKRPSIQHQITENEDELSKQSEEVLGEDMELAKALFSNCTEEITIIKPNDLS